MRRFPAAEATQGVAVDEAFFYAIDNAAIGKYEKAAGRRVGEWRDAASGRVRHLNSGIAIGRQLFAAHSNYPATPMASSIEVFDTERMAHVRSIPLPDGYGSATWVERRNGDWWVTFAHYAGRGGEPGKGPEATQLVRFDPAWTSLDSWRFPRAVVTRWDGMSSSGGVWLDERRLLTTGHHAREIYVVEVPGSGPELILKDLLAFESEGQGIALDRTSGLLYSIDRRTRHVLVSRVPSLE